MITWQSLYAWLVAVCLSVWSIVRVTGEQGAAGVKKGLAAASRNNRVLPSSASMSADQRQPSMSESMHSTGMRDAERRQPSLGRRASTLSVENLADPSQHSQQSGYVRTLE